MRPRCTQSLQHLLVRRSFEASNFCRNTLWKIPKLLRLRRLIDFLVNELDCERGPLSDLAVEEFEQHLLIAFLTGNAHNYSHLLEGQPLKAGPWQVRMAEEYIEAN